MEKLIFIGIIVVCLLGVLVILVKLIRGFNGQLKIAKVTAIKVASAGSVIADTPSEVKIQSLSSQKFYDNAGNLINPDEFDKFWVKGCSMLLCGIRDNDLLFTKPISLDNLSFTKPHVFVLRRDDHVRSEATFKNDLAEFKIRRTWAVVRVDVENIAACAREIILSQNFQDLKQNNSEAFLSEEDMLRDFVEERVSKYMNQYPTCIHEADENHIAIISTTLKASKGNKVTFSIHPARIIVGEVMYSFHM